MIYLMKRFHLKKEVRVIGANGEQLGVMSKRKAQNIASEANLDLLCCLLRKLNRLFVRY